MTEFTTIEQREQIKQITNRRETEKILFGNEYSSEDDELAEIHDKYLNTLIDAVSNVSIKEKDNKICKTPINPISFNNLNIVNIDENRKKEIRNNMENRNTRRQNKRKQPEPLQLPHPTIFKIKPQEDVVEDEYVQELIDDVKGFYVPLISNNTINNCSFEQEMKRLLYDLLESYYINYNTDNKEVIYGAFNAVYTAIKDTNKYNMDDLSKFKEELDGLHDDETLFNSRFEQPVSKRPKRNGGKKKAKTKKLKKKAKTKKSKMKKIKRKTMKKKKSKKHKR